VDTLEVAPVGVDTDLFRPAPPARPDVRGHQLGYVGRISLEKGVHALLAAMPALTSRTADLRLVVVGGGAALAQMRNLVHWLDQGDLRGAADAVRAAAGPHDEAWVAPVLQYWDSVDSHDYRSACRGAALARRISFTGPLPPARVASVLPGVDALVIPSLVREAYPLVALEALASGVPPVGLAHGGLAAVLDELAPNLGRTGAVLHIDQQRCPVTSLIDGLAVALAHLSDRQVREQARESCRSLAVARYDWERVVARLESVYRAAAAPGVHGGEPAHPHMAVLGAR
jgi:glycosyltransferase involved in cell wall biosynthesis